MTKQQLLKNAKPILFSTDMVKAILDGRKTQTRLIVKLKYSNTHHKMRTDKYGTRLIEVETFIESIHCVKNADGTKTLKIRPYIEKYPPYKIRDIVYVRETWCPCATLESYFTNTNLYTYKADYSDSEIAYLESKKGVKWKPSIHMPREAARIFLKATDVRVERLQDISESDARKEGCTIGDKISPTSSIAMSATQSFIWKWDIISKDKNKWAYNPYVWVIEFEKVEVDNA